MKFCKKCSTNKLTTDFHKGSGKDGLNYWCKVCNNSSKSAAEREIRLKALSILGGKCKCGFSDIRALQIDHVNGGGKQEAKDLGGFQQIYRKIASGNTEGYQILCANCNWIKRAEQNECSQRVF